MQGQEATLKVIEFQYQV